MVYNLSAFISYYDFLFVSWHIVLAYFCCIYIIFVYVDLRIYGSSVIIYYICIFRCLLVVVFRCIWYYIYVSQLCVCGISLCIELSIDCRLPLSVLTWIR